MNKAHVIDIETGDITETAHIYSIAVVTVDLDLDGDDLFLSYQECAIDKKQPGRTKSEKTSLWWANQSKEAIQAGFDAEFQYDIKNVLTMLSQKFEREPYPIWGNGADFDNRILAHAFAQYDLDWPYQLNRCLRTFKNVIKQVKPSLVFPEFEGVRHIALNDARYEAKELKILTDILKNREGK